MEVDHEIMRGVPLHWLLRRVEVWTSPDEIRRRNWTERVWNLSGPVSSHDVFLSHTWRSKGRWKVLALTMQSGWFHGLLAWFVGVALLLCFRAFDVIPDVWENVVIFLDGSEITISMEPWTVMSGGVFMVMGLCISPFLPLKTKICYLDAACIHLAHGELFERGVYSIGGCLSVAKELRVLYSPEYLCSCVYHLLAVAAGPGTFRPSECQVTKSFADVLSCCFVTRAWAVSAKIRNALMHALNGNGGGSRTSARKRKQKQDSAQGNVNMQQVSEILKLFTQLIQLLGLGGGRGGKQHAQAVGFSFWTR